MNKDEVKTVEAKETVVEAKDGFFKKSWTKTKEFAKKHKGAVIGAVAGSAATIAGLLYLGKDGMPNSETEAVNSESPMDE